jgi:2-polyprenyl-3-methyl-5-hydroxy-6-metoxy-1,4-benzoquinol methylase
MASQINNAVYDELANTWWRDDGFLQTLHALNPGLLARHFPSIEQFLDLLFSQEILLSNQLE